MVAEIYEAVWDGRDSTGRSSPSGSYLLASISPGFTQRVSPGGPARYTSGASAAGRAVKICSRFHFPDRTRHQRPAACSR